MTTTTITDDPPTTVLRRVTITVTEQEYTELSALAVAQAAHVGVMGPCFTPENVAGGILHTHLRATLDLYGLPRAEREPEPVDLVCPNWHCPEREGDYSAVAERMVPVPRRWEGLVLDDADGSFEVVENADCPACGTPGEVI